MLLLAAIPKLAIFLIVFFVTLLILGSFVLLRVVHWEERRRKKMDREAWNTRKKDCT